jgi:hypothetical protein
MLTNEERKRVSEYLRVSSPNAQEVLTVLDKVITEKVVTEKAPAEKK